MKLNIEAIEIAGVKILMCIGKTILTVAVLLGITSVLGGFILWAVCNA